VIVTNNCNIVSSRISVISSRGNDYPCSRGTERSISMRILEGAAMLAAFVGAQALAIGTIFVH
jgi:hypothetical protein